MNGTPASGPADAPASTAWQERAYESALSMLDRDAEILDQLRARANILLAALAIGVTALGAILASAAHTRMPTWLAALLMGFLVAAVLCCVGVLWSVRDRGEFTSSRLRRVIGEIEAGIKKIPARADDDAPIRARATLARDRIGTATQAYAEAISVVDSLKQVLGLDAGKATADSAKKELKRAKARAASARKQLGRARADARDREYEALRREHAEAQKRIYAAARAHAKAQAEVDTAWRAHVEAGAAARAAGGPDDHVASGAGHATAIAAALARAASAGAKLTEELATAADLGRIDGWRYLGQRMAGSRAGRAWLNFERPWRVWRRALGHDRRLWKTKLAREDLSRVPSGASPDEVDRVLLEIMYLAHYKNDSTLSRRADLLRLASLLVAAFVIALGAWLPSHV